jgi:hypothetical protein
MMMKKILLFPLLLLSLLAFSQDANLVYYDYIYLDNIKSVKFHVTGLPTTMPAIDLNGPSNLFLSFDDMDGGAKDYVYSIVHCDANWRPSTNITEFDYLDGFSEGRIQDYAYSFKVQTDYTHYWLSLPNADMRLKISGNYLLKVYDDENEKQLAITRRFLVVDNKVNVAGKAVRPARVDKMDTHQEIDFSVFHENFEVRNPMQELNAIVLQNGRWDNAITGLKPLYSKQAQEVFDYQDKIVFPAGKEFRYIDLRGIRYPDPRIISLGKEADGRYVSVLERDKKRGSMPYFEWRDINGNFIIENTDERGRINYSPNSRFSAGDFITQLTAEEEQAYQLQLAQATSNQQKLALQQQRQNLINQRKNEADARERQLYGEDSVADDLHSLQSEYLDVLVQLYSPGEMEDQDLYVFGGLTDWQLKPAFKMTYNPATNCYVANLHLKQGYYEYLYAAVQKGSNQIDFEETEGDWHETENYYSIFVYYRPFGGRYDQIIGAYSFSSRE